MLVPSTHWRRSAFLVLLLVGLFLSGCENTDIGMAVEAGADAVRALTLDAEDVRQLAVQVAAQSDRRNEVAPPGDPHAERLRRLTRDLGTHQGHTFDFRVYRSPTVNAFALADGSIRIYSGLMERMDDAELLFVIGHEMGHVVGGHVQEKLRLAYAGRAVRKAVASQRSEAGDLARSVIGALAEQLVNAQFSQAEEREADDYGVRFLNERDLGVQPAVSALNKLAAAGGGHSFLSSHPAPDARAERLLDGPAPSEEGPPPSLVQRIAAWLLELWPFSS